MTLFEQISQDVKTALKAQDSLKVSTLRLLIAAIQKAQIDTPAQRNEPPADAAVISAIDKQCKQRRESIAQFEQAQRTEAAERERQELEILSTYLPAAASADEIEAQITQALKDANASSPAQLGAVMGLLKARLAGRADMSVVAQQAKSRLTH